MYLLIAREMFRSSSCAEGRHVNGRDNIFAISERIKTWVIMQQWLRRRRGSASARLCAGVPKPG